MICETCAPESENVTTDRGWRIIASTTSWSSLTRGWMKNCFRCFSSDRSIRTSRGSLADSRAICAIERYAGRGDGIVHALVKGTPIVRQFAELHDAEGGRHVAFERERLQPPKEVVQPLGGRQVFLRDFEDPGLQGAHHPNQRPHFVPRREPPGNRTTLGRLMCTRPRAAETGASLPHPCAQC